MNKIIILLLSLFFAASLHSVNAGVTKKVIIFVEGNYDLTSYATAEGRQLANLLGHFETTTTIKGVNKYAAHDINDYDYIFYIGYHQSNHVPAAFLQDITTTNKSVIWINNGFLEFSESKNTQKQYGFKVTQFDKTSGFDHVRSGNKLFTKGIPDINLIQISDKKIVQVLATAFSSRTKKETPYIVKSGNLLYISDSPFQTSTETDRYLLFADMLHDILNEPHQEAHQAIIRIEDVTAMDDPDKLRDIADILSERNIPFLVGVVPFYVNPSEGMRVSLSEKPEVVDALKYMVENGGTIVMHGVTHQYRGISTDDFEFWDGMSKKPIKDENEADITHKLEMGIEELMKNGLFPVLWETPHYTASFLTYQTVSKFFSTAIEQRLSIEDADYSQYFPYIIQKDQFGQKIYPENLGYVPLNPNFDTSKTYVKRILDNARVNLNVRDGFASCFFHSFLNLNLLISLVDGIQEMGFTFIDVCQQKNWVKTKDRVILTGSQSYTIQLNNSFLNEAYYDKNGDLFKRETSDDRIIGDVSKTITLEPGQIYKAEPIEYHIKELSSGEKLLQSIKNNLQQLSPKEKKWREAKVCIYWNQYARGASYNDQASLASVFNSVNIIVDTVFMGQKFDPLSCNLLIVPFTTADYLKPAEIDQIVQYVKSGGNLITDRKNNLIEKLDIKFTKAEIKLRLIRDNHFPQEHIAWKYSQLADKFNYSSDDEVFCEDASTGSAVVLGKMFGKGKLIYFNTAFDPYSKLGYSQYPYILDYVKEYLDLDPVFKRENLEVYFEPGFRQNSSIENLIKQWVKKGIRIVHVAGWHQYPKYTYDYKRLINLAHANGILVIAWIEPPQVSQKFWNQHPEWREKNYKGDDISAGWRKPVALTDEKCLKTVLNEYTKFLEAYDWDGVNIGELYFDSDHSFSKPEFYSPMHPSVRKEVMKKYGFDPVSLFNTSSEFYWKTNHFARECMTRYRIDKIAYLHERVLQCLSEIAAKKKGFQIIITTMDSYGSPELKEILGINIDKIIALQKKYNFLLQVEDPSNKWSTDPTRYEAMGKFYREKTGDANKILLDLNILSLREKDEVTPFPTLIQTGIESYQLIKSTALGASRFTIYSESSTNPQDLSMFSYASAADVKYSYIDNGYEVNTPRSFVLKLPNAIKIIHIDNKPVIGSRDNMFMIPAGNHNINTLNNDIAGFSTVELQPQILSLTGNLLAVDYGMRKVKLTYESSGRALISINRMVASVKLDNKTFNFEMLKGNDCYSFFLPEGTHDVEIITGDKFSFGINVTSLFSSQFIVIFGSLGMSLLLLMYLGLKIIRRKIEK